MPDDDIKGMGDDEGDIGSMVRSNLQHLLNYNLEVRKRRYYNSTTTIVAVAAATSCQKSRRNRGRPGLNRIRFRWFTKSLVHALYE